MNHFKKIMAQSHMQNKECLHKLYTDRQIYISTLSSSEQPVEDEKIFHYRDLSFSFAGTGFRTPESVVLYVWVPGRLVGCEKEMDRERIPCEDWLLRTLSGPVNALSQVWQNDHKDAREKLVFSMQEVGPVVRRRNGCLYMEPQETFRIRVSLRFPLINGHSVNGKSGFKGLKLLLDTVCDSLEAAERKDLQEHVQFYQRQWEIRDYLKKKDLLAFVADGSILPRQGDTPAPMDGAVPFQSPPQLRVAIPLSDGTRIEGMGIKKGITIITGGGYSGKSTLLDALEQGIYFHVAGDGREYVIVEETACKIYAEDGRVVRGMDISPFFSHLPGDGDRHDFSTPHASGSLSQAVNIVEAVYGGSRLLLIDEDTSATNFMIRDRLMRQLVQREPIIPYTDRVRELRERDVSTILVIGGSGEYLEYGDCILLLEDYQVQDRTGEVKALLHREKGKGSAFRREDCQKSCQKPPCTWMERRALPPKLSGEELFYGRSVRIDNGCFICLGDMTADITRLTALGDEGQINTLAWLLEQLLWRSWQEGSDLNACCGQLIQNLFADSQDVVLASRSHEYDFWLEEVRSLDLVMAAGRLRRTINFCKTENEISNAVSHHKS